MSINLSNFSTYTSPPSTTCISGRPEHNEGKKSYYLAKIKTDGVRSGTALMKKVVQISLAEGCKGRVHLAAAYSSHIFHLKMGMVPKERSISYVKNKYGTKGVSVLERLKESKLTSRDKEYLRDILQEEKKLEIVEMTDAIIAENLEFFNHLYKKGESYIQNEFIPSLLEILEKDLNVRPNTTQLYHVDMYLSKEGKNRWKKCVEHDEPFESFRHFEPLTAYMTIEQQEKLKKILTLRGEGLKERRIF